MRYLWVLVLVALAAAQQGGDKKAPANQKSDKKEDQPLFKSKVQYKSSKGTKESATMSFNGVDPSGRVTASMMASTPTAEALAEAKRMAYSQPSGPELMAFLKEGGLKQGAAKAR
jgi:hypothetical protein